MSSDPKIIVITGAESTGKTTLAEALANHFKVPVVPEYARDYIQNLERNYTFEDVEFIAKQQVKQLNMFLKEKYPLIILDTWLLITKVWFEVVFKTVPDWIEQEIRKTNIDLFLVCDTDLPWIADNVRENGGVNRTLLQKKYIDEIEKYSFAHKIVGGKNMVRTHSAIQFIAKL